MKSAVVTFPASNCNRDMFDALEKITGQRPHEIWHQDTDVPNVDLIALPGGFSFGDYLRCGAMAARSPAIKAVAAHAERGGNVIGVCNGFQVLTEMGLLPGALMRNRSLKFVCKTVQLKVENENSTFTNAYNQGQVINIPVAHHDGNYFADDETLARIEDNGQVAFRYVNHSGEATKDANPNGSQNNIAGIMNEQGNILGMMPHPERLIEDAQGGTDGRGFFDSIINSLN
ncbi:phosphoribosylformylglycinamidine synthase subunit PurQ [Emcibacteraceae bacterium]|jgi:phosphoribosylformylglycinamidine synthase subunit PurQ / glutaminase|nr:phosphoribosylformylglycinamidine synthase subunit PurQ [Kordiimonadaceae bacterium]MDA9553886.1 phosphoribosylformylglycinamidine synthase subunit PurQ [Emcibacteraceae bacterium]MDA9770924.1 phosphoribosylformylglycinamidine synthase subunit PurQ [Emcibacteraceae bacterium]MDC1090662.1 phosphoribosylformylglycinamidine synthase subunit PurQ [Emcibacteraceae bacterium]